MSRSHRPDSPPRHPRAKTLPSFTFNGREVEIDDGDTFAAALLRAGIAGIRRSLTERPRGMYCGIGVCMECEIYVDGVPQRACMVEARPAEVTTGAAWRTIGEDPTHDHEAAG